jgi:3-dehydroquinate dehydratase/shikimate dehydrogenase
MTLLCVPILVHDVHAALHDAALAKSRGADLVEFRIDELFSGSGDERETREILRLVAGSPLPCVVTCRAADEGGHYDGDDTQRASLYERLGTASGPGELPPRYLDIELAAYTRSENLKQKINLAVDHPDQGRDLATSLILSAHDFQTRPPDLTRIVLSMRRQPAARVLKIAFRARSLRDNLELFELLGERDRPMIALGMGEFGLMSRVLAPKFGAFLTFASLRSAAATAPGQPTIDELLSQYRFRSIGPGTGVYGVVGWPVGHSLGPLVHNAGFGAAGHDGVYLPLPIPAGDDAEASYLNFKATLLELLAFEPLRFRGCSVTVPHKEHLVRLARERGWGLDATSAAIGAANTMAVGEGGVVRVWNTDAPALAGVLRDAAGDLRGVNAGVLGAGGVSRAAAFAIASAGANAVVYNRTRDRADRLVADLGPALPPGSGKLVAADWDALPKACCSLWVNATPVGMKDGPDPEGSPLPIEGMTRCGTGTAVLDTVYTPLRTPLLRAAAAAGWTIIEGVGMFARQAEAQSAAWTGRPPPPGLFEGMARQELVRRG